MDEIIKPQTIDDFIEQVDEAALVKTKDAELAFPIISDEMIQRAERSVENVIKARQLALRVTNAKDWIDMGGKPYLTESGCQKVRALFGLPLRRKGEVKEEVSNIDGKTVYTYVCTYMTMFNGQPLEVEGVSSSADKFFCMRGNEPIPLQEIDLRSVRKKAVTNAMARAITKVLGLGNLTWDDVNAAHVDRSRVAGVSYRKGAQGGRATGPDSSEAVDLKIKLQERLARLSDLSGAEPRQLLKECSSFIGQKDGKEHWATDIQKMSEGWIRAAIGRADEAIANFEVPGIREPGEEG